MNRGYRLAAEVGGTKLQAALGTADGRVVARERRGTGPGEGAEAILHWLEDALEALLAKGAALGHRPEAVGIGFGGPVETASGTVVTSHQVPGWQGIPLRRQLEDRFGLPVTVANDANAAGWAEYCCGAGEGTSPFFYMNIGSGIGGALVLDGRLHDGQGRGAGEIGHTYIPDWTAAAGTAVRLEERCSGWAIERRIRAWTVSDPSCTWARLCGNDPRTLSCSLLAEAARPLGS